MSLSPRILTPRLHKAVTESLAISKPAKVYFFQWAQKWYYSNLQQEGSEKADLPNLICVLQAIGFKLRKFEKKEQQLDVEEDEVKNGNVRITMECGSSMMTAVLEMDNIECQCPDNNEANDGTLWSVTGTAPMDYSHNTEETGSNLLPDLPKSTIEIVRDVTLQLFKIINIKADDMRENITSHLNPIISQTITPTSRKPGLRDGLVRSYTDMYKEVTKEANIREMNKSITQYFQRSKTPSATPKSTPRKPLKPTPRNILNPTKTTSATAAAAAAAAAKKLAESKERPVLRREGTYEMEAPTGTEDIVEEPRSTPPCLSSSPVGMTRLSDTLSRLSLQSDDDPVLEDYVFRAYRILDAAVKHIVASAPVITASNLSLSGQEDSGNFTRPSCPSRLNSSFSSPHSESSSSINNIPSSSSNSSRPNSQTAFPIPAPRTNQHQPLQQRASIAGPTPTHRGASVLPGARSSGLPLTRDRSSSFSAAQRPVINKGVIPPGPTRHNTSLSFSTLGRGNTIEKSTTAGQRSTSTGLKPPSSNKPPQQRNSIGTNSAERPVRLAKRHVSPNTSLSSSMTAKTLQQPHYQQQQQQQQQQRANSSLIKPPTSRYSIGNHSISGLNSSKFGYGQSKK